MNFLETASPQNSILEETVRAVKRYFCVLKTFLLLAVGIVHTGPDHPTDNTRSVLICSREGFDPTFAVTDVCPKKAPMLLTVTYVLLTHKQCYCTPGDLPE